MTTPSAKKSQKAIIENKVYNKPLAISIASDYKNASSVHFKHCTFTALQVQCASKEVIFEDCVFTEDVKIKNRARSKQNIEIIFCGIYHNFALLGKFEAISFFRTRFVSIYAPDFANSTIEQLNFQSCTFVIKKNFRNMLILLHPNLAGHLDKIPKILLMASFIALVLSPFSFLLIVPIMVIAFIVCLFIFLANPIIDEAMLARRKENEERFRYLKQDAISRNEFQDTVLFTSLEDRASWGNDAYDPIPLVNIIFAYTCNYGQSVLRPLLLLLFDWFFFTLFYMHFAVSDAKNILQQAAIFSATNLFPISIAGKGTLANSGFPLFGEQWPSTLNLAQLIQSVVSIVILIIIALGVRNKFKMKV